MDFPAQYVAEVLPLYRHFVIGDPYCDADEDDADDARSAGRSHVIAATRYHAYLYTAQQVVEVSLRLRLWEGEPQYSPERDAGGSWEDLRPVTIECPEAQLIFDNVTAGPVLFQPGPVGRINLPNGPGAYTLHVATRGRSDINQLVATNLANDIGGDIAQQLEPLYGHEQYLIDVWQTGPLSEEDE